MIKRNGQNERVKRRYLAYLKDVKGRDEASIDAVAKALDRFQEYTKNRDFKKFHVEQVRAFKAHLASAPSARTGEPLSDSTVHSTFSALKSFFTWLALQRGYRSHIDPTDVEYFNTPDKVSRVATARRYKACPTIKQVRAMLEAMPEGNEIERRDRAVIAFALVSGARDRAVVSFKLKHIDLESERIEQDARQVRTKRAKTFTTWFFPVGDDIRDIFVDWVKFLREQKGFGPDDPLFPKSWVAPGDDLAFHTIGLDKAHWANANPVRAIFKEACALAGLPYFNPHSIRNTLVQLAYERKLDPERFKAWSQNLGHENCLTTFSSYGEVLPSRQAEIIGGLAKADDASESHFTPDLLRRLAEQMERRGSPP